MTELGTSVLSVRGLCKNFGALAVTQMVNLDLDAGARVGLIGPNGAGKTTLVNLLTGMIPIDAGEISLSGKAIHGLKPEERVKRGPVRTHQINTLLTETNVRENVAIAIAERDGYAWRSMRYAKQWRACWKKPKVPSMISVSAMLQTGWCPNCPMASNVCWKSLLRLS